MFKLFNLRRTLARMEKYDYQRQSMYYKIQKSLLRRYDSATNKADKQYARELMKKTWEAHKSDNTVTKQKQKAKDIINKVNEEAGREILTLDNIADFYDFAIRVRATMSDVFFDSREVIVKEFENRVVNKRMTVADAIDTMRKEGIIL